MNRVKLYFKSLSITGIKKAVKVSGN